MPNNTPTNAETIDHDRLFKELLTTFFVEFVDLFLPDVSAYLERDSLEFLDKEVFTDVTTGDKHEVDILVKARFRGEETCFLIHVENQSSAQGDFPQRMFRYFARLYEKFGLPIYPVVLFSYDAPKRAEPTQFKVTFPNKTVLDFRYTVIQLNRLPWRRFVNQSNPVAAALMAKMKIAAKDRPKVKMQCLRLLATLRLNPAKARLISGFVDQYLRLNTVEQQTFQRQFAALDPQEREEAMVFTTSWKEEGRAEGKAEGKAELLTRLLEKRFGRLPASLLGRLHQLSSAQLDALGEALFDFSSLADVQAWIQNQR